MTILGIDTATQVCSAAVVRNGTVLAQRLEIAPQRHAELLLPFVMEVIEESKLKPDEIDRISVSIGPGSFTGLRIGLSVVKGIAAGLHIPVVPVPTMDSTAYRAFQIESDAESVAVILPARRDEYYYGSFIRNEKKTELLKGILVYSTRELLAVAADDPTDIFAGEGVERLSGDTEIASPDSETLSRKLKHSLAKKLNLNDAAFTAIISNDYKPEDIASLEPMYIKEFESGSSKYKKQPQRPEQ